MAFTILSIFREDSTDEKDEDEVQDEDGKVMYIGCVGEDKICIVRFTKHRMRPQKTENEKWSVKTFMWQLTIFHTQPLPNITIANSDFGEPMPFFFSKM